MKKTERRFWRCRLVVSLGDGRNSQYALYLSISSILKNILFDHFKVLYRGSQHKINNDYHNLKVQKQSYVKLWVFL
jgi:hypothetical protein